MASKKSKVLAIAFCAAVMAGIHVNPVLAAEIPVNNGSVTVGYKDFETTTGYEEDSQVTITNIASQKDLAQETADREKKDAEHDSAIKNETLDREAADNKIKADLQADINAKDEQSKDRDSQLQANIDTEAEAREKADADLQDQIDGHTNQIESMGDQLDDLKAKDEKQDETLKGHTNQIDSMGDQLDDLKANDEVQDETLKGHTNQIESMGDQLDDLKAKDEKQDATLEGHTNQIESMGDQLDDLKAKDEVQDADIDKLQENDAVQDADIDKLQENDAVQDDILDAHGQQIGDNTAAIKNHTSVIGVEDNSQLKNEYADTNYISGANDMAEADVILDREISNVNSRVDGIENRVDGLEDRIDKVGAMSAAIANLRTMGYDPAAPTEVAVGVGQYRDETGMALGLFHYPNRDFMLSLSVSTSGDEYMGGIGATWKFGRKSPEKVAEIKKAQAEADARRAEEQKLAKAEEMKKAAKEAKVQAQMERHAKLAAERAALEEA